jgi:hypothetical protein
MEYLILNNHSLPFDKKEDINNALIQFFNIYNDAIKINFKTIRITSSLDNKWYSIPLSPTYYLRDWINEQDDDLKLKIKTLIASTQTPILDTKEVKLNSRLDLSYFSYEEQLVPTLGACALMDELSISFNSDKKWNKLSFDLKHEEITENEEIIKNNIKVKNVTSPYHWKYYFNLIESQMIQNLKDSNQKLDDFSTLFPYIRLTSNAQKQLEKNKFPNPFFKKIWQAITLLNNYSEDSNNKKSPLNYTDAIAFTKLNLSDESDSVKGNDKLNRHRNFRYNGEKLFFGHHIKNFPSGNRMHFRIHENEIIIGYIGKHLPT